MLVCVMLLAGIELIDPSWKFQYPPCIQMLCIMMGVQAQMAQVSTTEGSATIGSAE